MLQRLEKQSFIFAGFIIKLVPFQRLDTEVTFPKRVLYGIFTVEAIFTNLKSWEVSMVFGEAPVAVQSERYLGKVWYGIKFMGKFCPRSFKRKLRITKVLNIQ